MTGAMLWVALVLVFVAMRFQLSALPPLLPDIEAQLALSHGWAGGLTALSFAMMGFGALATPGVLRWVSPTRAIAITSLVITLSGLARAAASDAVSVIAVGIPLGLAVGIETALLPSVARQRFPGQAALVTGLCVAGLSIGSALSSAAAVPMAHLLGGWRPTLVALAATGAMLTLPWLGIAWRTAAKAGGGSLLPGRPTSAAAWLAIAVFTLQTMLFFGLYTWLPSAATERGWTDTMAGLLGSGVIASSLAGSVLVTALPRGTWTDRALIISAVAAVAGCVGYVLAPDAPWLATVLGGASTGALFVLALRLPLEIVDDPRDVANLSAVMLAVGYWAGALAPVLLGSLRDATGTFSSSFASLVVLSVLLLGVCVSLTTVRSRVA